MKLKLLPSSYRRLIIIGLLLFSHHSFAQQAHTISGHITDAVRQKPYRRNRKC